MKSFVKHWKMNTLLWVLSLVLSNAIAFVQAQDINTLNPAVMSERDILDLFYEATNGDNWSRNDNWDSPNVCIRFGITCHEQFKTVTRINLPGNNLSSKTDSDGKRSLPEQLFQLVNLRSLNLGDNDIDVDFSHLAHAEQLEFLYLHSTSISSLEGIGFGQSSLSSLHLNNNDFNGERIPEEIYALTEVKRLYMSNCNLAGKFPEQIFLYLKGLEELDLSQNRLKGTIPEFSMNMNDLVSINLENNVLTGDIPESINFLLNLEELYLGEQRKVTRNGEKTGLSGNLPNFEGLHALKVLDVSSNSLKGIIPSDFLNGITYKDRMVTLDLSDNFLTGSLPKELSQFELLNIKLENNKFSGIHPDLCLREKWMKGNVKLYGCDAILCPTGSSNDYGRQVSVGAPCRDCEVSHGALFYGSTECADPEEAERKILSHLYSQTGGDSWKINKNWDSDDDICNWYGVDCADGANEKKGFVYRLVLDDNGLVGTVPTEVFRLPGLRHLELNENDIDIDLKGLKHANNIARIFIQETSIKNLDGISKASSSLITLHAGNNDFEASQIPDEIFLLTKLKDLDLEQLNFVGPISQQIGSLTNLERLNLFDNDLTGTIPKTIGNLRDLDTLILSHNRLSGSVPSEIEQLTSLSSLYLERQRAREEEDKETAGFSGTLPSFSEFEYIDTIFLNDNSFTGAIPKNFLKKSVMLNETINLHLSSNQLTGEIPSEFSRFKKLNLYLVENQIHSVANRLCNKGEWMSGTVSQYGCDAILCPVNTYNKQGRQVDDETPCMDCDEDEMTLHLGASECLDYDKETLRQTEKYALVEIFSETVGEKWRRKDDWLSEDVDHCDWYGIYCEDETFVSMIQLSDNNLEGTLYFHQQIKQFSRLTELDLALNPVDLKFVDEHSRRLDDTHLVGGSKIEKLNIHSTKVKSLDGVRILRKLRELHAEKNSFGGNSIPSDIYELYDLEQLFFSESELSGSISNNIKQLSQLEGLYMYGNDLSGQLPKNIGQLSKLNWIALAENRFTGTLPTSLGNLKELKALSLADQKLKPGGGISGDLLDFSKNSVLTSLFLSNNKIEGSIPHSFLKSSDPEVLYTVDLSSNEITGTLPSSLARFERLAIDITDNEIIDIDPELCKMKEWMDGNVEAFECDAILCPAGTYNDLGRREEDGDKCHDCDSTYRQDILGAKKCKLPHMSEREILELFYKGLRGDDWKVHTNWLTRDKDVCTWHGIACTESGEVESINLGSNNLVGLMPNVVFQLQALDRLSLYGNSIEFDFDRIENAESLTTMILDSTELKSLEGIGKAVALEELTFRFSKVSGTLPDEIFKLKHLKTLVASDNNLSGSLKPYFANFSKIEKLGLSSNEFDGPLVDFSGLSHIEHIDLASNSFTGTIPQSFLQDANFSEHLFIDLSSNELTGQIPKELSKFKRPRISFKDNRFGGIHSDICEVTGWNYGTVGTYGCDAVMCPRGTYNEIGRQADDKTPCLKCKTARFYGSITCNDAKAKRQRNIWWGVAVLSMSLGFYVFYMYYRGIDREDIFESARMIDNDISFSSKEDKHGGGSWI